MRTILDILAKAGGWHPGLYLKIDNLPYMELVIEAVHEPGPMGLPALSVAHYGEQNGDLMRDPEMCFELGFGDRPELSPYYYRNDYVGVEQWSRNLVRAHYVCLEQLHRQHERFAAPVVSAGCRIEGCLGACRLRGVPWFHPWFCAGLEGCKNSVGHILKGIAAGLVIGLAVHLKFFLM